MRFFIEGPVGETALVCGEDARHISKVLRLSRGDEITLCDMQGKDYTAVIENADTSSVAVRITGSMPCAGEPKLKVRLYQALPKSDKMELIVQKAVELGACEIVPVLSHRCVARPDKGSMPKKLERWQRIAYEAAKQSGRGTVPRILPLMDFESAVRSMAESGNSVILYENSVTPLSGLLNGFDKSYAFSVMVGPEGGFEPEEIELAGELGIADASLGARILRCETAPMAVLASIMYHFGEF